MMQPQVNRQGSFGMKSTGLKPGGAGGAPAGAKKKMVIKPFKVQPKLPENFEDDTWEKLHKAVVAVQLSQPVATSREELYRGVEDLCVHKMGLKLYTRLQAVCDRHVQQQLAGLAGQALDLGAFLQLVDTVWSSHCDHMITIRNIFLYLDRSIVLQTPHLRSLWDMGLVLFRDHLSRAGDVESRIIQALLTTIERERNGETANRMLLRSLLRMLGSLQIYEQRFEHPFLEQTAQYYTAEGSRYMASADVPQFLQHVELRLQQEADRVVHYLDSSTRKPLIQAVEARLLKPHTQLILERGFDVLMEQHRLSDLKRMHQLFQRVGALGELKCAFSMYVQKRGLEIVCDQEKDRDMVENLLAYKRELDTALDEAFERNGECLQALKDAWERFINARQGRPAELLAKFVDHKLRGEKGTTDEEVEALLDRVMVLFRYLHSKDVFEAFYKKELAKRLLLGKSSSFDLEKSMISKLKTECGAGYTTKLEGMFKDIHLSRDLMGHYAQYMRDKRNDPGFFRCAESRDMDSVVQVLTLANWPAYPVMDCCVPTPIQEHMDKFSAYYDSKYQGRRVVWQPTLGTCIVKAAFPKGKKELNVSQLQALVLLSFNSRDAVSFKELLAETRIEDQELRRTLQSLACGKKDVRVLQKEPKGKDVEDGDQFLFNLEFTQKLYRIKINSIQLKETVEENEKTHDAVFRDRQYQVDAAIVRIMKARKTLSHTLLMSELLGQLKFPAKPMDLKKRIESLIEREYLERDEHSAQVYNYLA